MDRDRYLFNKMNNLYKVYSSRFSGSFDLKDTFRYPKMCAKFSLNMTEGVKYYIGQKEMQYVIGQESQAGAALDYMDRGKTWMFQNGTSSEGLLGRFDEYYQGGSIFVQTDYDKAADTHRTVLRGCSRMNELIELYLYVEVVDNTYPDFVEEIETTWTLSVNDVYEYKLPRLEDKEGNDVPEVYVAEMANQPYPPFLYFDNHTNTLIFRPNSIWYQGRNYYFQIVVKEENSDSIKYPYYCTVKMSGNIIDPMEYLNFTDITWKITEITRDSTGAVEFSHPVNLPFVQEHWDEMFDVYIKNVTFKDH
mmetsp:Transcript_12357/g.19192  ORF Transcript_12357/g.19192 Transcript_12357/m.19192 type:complete len:306 (+) Transcript_12357:1499-2416(+)